MWSKNIMSEIKENEEVYSQKLKLGKRSYFFDVKKTEQNNYYITITEKIKQISKNENSSKVKYKKTRIYVVPEDCQPFIDGLSDTLTWIKNNLKIDLSPRRHNITNENNS